VNEEKPNIFRRKFHLPFASKLASPELGEIRAVTKSLSLKERVVFWFFAWLFLVVSIIILWEINKSYLMIVPARGGSFSEGITGNPRFINPILSISNADQALVSLIYSGLLRVNPSGGYINDLAKSFNISEDGLIYIFTLKDNILWHDGNEITTDDLIFTINKVKDPILKSPRRASWEGVNVTKINDKQIQFELKQPYSPFLENTTLGILPEHIWGKISSEEFTFSTFNTEPVGSGPYKLSNIKNKSTGVPLYYELEAFNKFNLSQPLINKIKIQFFQNDEALLSAYNSGEIDAVGGLGPLFIDQITRESTEVIGFPLTRIFALFLNQNEAQVFTNKEVREALLVSIDKEAIVNDILRGYGKSVDAPIPLPEDPSEDTLRESEERSPREEALEILLAAGWTFNEEIGILEKRVGNKAEKLAFSISTADVPDLKKVAQILKESWEQLGAQVDLKVFEIGDLNQNVIRTRDYDSLLFGQINGRNPDPFAFWHSSQRLDPGLNVALYANIKVDSLLEEARRTLDQEERIKKYEEFNKEIRNDLPAIFLYSPDFIYITDKKIKGLDSGSITVQSERFLNVYEWYIYTNNIWTFFLDK